MITSFLCYIFGLYCNAVLGATFAFPVTGGTGTSTAPGLNSILIGNAGGVYDVKTLTQGTGISITNSGGTVTIASLGGASGSTWATTTSQVAGTFINYPNNNTDVVAIGDNSTTTAPWYYDPINKLFLMQSASSTISGPITISGTGTIKGDFLFEPHNTYNIGQDGASSPASIHAADHITSPVFRGRDNGGSAFHDTTVRGGNATTGNKDGGTLTLAGGTKHGSGTDGSIIMQTAGVTRLTVGPTGTINIPGLTASRLVVTDASSNLSTISTSTLGIAISDTTGTLTVSRGGTGQTSFTASQLLYGNNANALSSVATTSLTLSGAFSHSGTLGAFVGGSSGTLSLATNGVALTNLAQIPANSVLGNVTGATGNVTALATSTITQGTGITITGSGSLVAGSGLTITNAGVTSNVAGDGISVSGATGAVTISNSGKYNIATSSLTVGQLVHVSATSPTSFTSIATSTLGIAISDTTGTLTIARGGTNATSQASNGINYFDGTSITSEAALTYNASTDLLTTVNATTTNLTVASFFKTAIVTAIQTVAGAIGIDTTSEQLRWYGGATYGEQVALRFWEPSLLLSTTTSQSGGIPYTTGTSTYHLGARLAGMTLFSVHCRTSNDTMLFQVGDGTASTTDLWCVPGAGRTTGSLTNNTFVSREAIFVGVGSSTTTDPGDATITFTFEETPD